MTSAGGGAADFREGATGPTVLLFQSIRRALLEGRRGGLGTGTSRSRTFVSIRPQAPSVTPIRSEIPISHFQRRRIGAAVKGRPSEGFEEKNGSLLFAGRPTFQSIGYYERQRSRSGDLKEWRRAMPRAFAARLF